MAISDKQYREIATRVLRTDDWTGSTDDQIWECVDIAVGMDLLPTDHRSHGPDDPMAGAMEHFSRWLQILTSNDSPCWQCGRGSGDIVWDDASSEYRHSYDCRS